MAHLALCLLGSYRVTLDGRPVTAFKSNKVRALLAYLAVEADLPHRREVLAGLLWPDWPDSDAFSNLRYALSDLRRTVEDRTAEPPYLFITRDTLQFNPASDHSLDARALMELGDETAIQSASAEQLERAVALYRGSFLEGFSLDDSPVFEEWTLLTRERLARQVSFAHHRLAAIYEQRGEFTRAQSCARRQIELEPWDEVAHGQLIRCLALGGQRSAALAQYETCRRMLAEELGVEPAEETTRLYRQVRDGKLRDLPAAAPVPQPDAWLPPFLDEEPPHVEAPLFVARERELVQLNAFLVQALAGRGRVVWVTGEVGAGKTALLGEFVRRVQVAPAGPSGQGQAPVIAGGSCNAYTGIGDPYLPFREILGLLTGDVEARWAAGAMTREQACSLWKTFPWTAQILVDSGPDLIDTFVRRAALLERASKAAPGTGPLAAVHELLAHQPVGAGMPAAQQSSLFEQYTRVLQALARQVPLLLVLDDLQWADMGTISLLFHLGRHLDGSRILILGAYRPEEVAIGRGGERHPLEPVVNELQRVFGDIVVNLGQAESRDFVDAVLDSEPNRLGTTFREMLYRQTRGHPLFTIELLRGLQERGDLLPDAEGRWVEGPDLNWGSLPARVEAVIAERIGRLSEPLRAALRVASVEGEVFTAEVVARIRGAGDAEMLGCLSSELDKRHRLVRAQSIRRLDGQFLSSYSFRHILFQKYLYGTLDEVERVRLHEQVGTALERLNSAQDEAVVLDAQMALHFEKARIAGKAIHYLHRAGEKAVQLSAYREGRAHLTRGLDLLLTLPPSPERDRQELALQISLGRTWMVDMPAIERESAITRARELCSRAGTPSELCWVLGELAIFHYVRGEYRKAYELGEELIGLAEQAGDPVLLSLGHWCVGFVLFGLGEYRAARVHLAQVTSFYAPLQRHQPFVLLGADGGVSAIAYDACALWCLGYPEQALKRSREALDLARGIGHSFSLADVLTYAGCTFESMRGNARKLLDFAKELEQLSKGMGSSSFGGMGTCFRGEALARLGQVEEGIACMRASLAKRRSHGDLCYQSGVMASLAMAEATAGRLAEGLATLAEALAFVEESGERHWESELRRLQGELLLAQGDEAAAEASLRHAVEVARRQEARSWELRAVMSLGRLWQRQGKEAEARDALTEVYNWFTEGFDTPDLRDARALLAELA